MSVLDGSMIQLQFGWRVPSGHRIFFAYASQILLNGFFTDGHQFGDRFHRHTGCIELQRAPFLLTERWPIDIVIGGQDVSEARGNPVPACGNLPDRQAYLAGLLILERVTACPGVHRRPDGERLFGRREN